MRECICCGNEDDYELIEVDCKGSNEFICEECASKVK